MPSAITDIPGIKVGHYTNKAAATGCTVVLCEGGAVGGVDIRGSAPGTRETDLLRPMNLVERVHAICLSGGSAFGLDAASGVMRYLEERGCGFDTSVARVPIVPAAILFDLGIGSARVRPGAKEGYQACFAASEGGLAEGSVGAGTGATVGKVLGMERATKSGLGTASQRLPSGTAVGALVVVNAFGDIVDPATGQVIAAPRHPAGRGFLRTSDILRSGQGAAPFPSTILGVVATDAPLTKEQANKLAQMAHDGVARTVQPAHTMFDGDVCFALSTGTGQQTEMTVLGAVAAEVVAAAVVRAVVAAESLCGIPAAREVGSND